MSQKTKKKKTETINDLFEPQIVVNLQVLEIL